MPAWWGYKIFFNYGKSITGYKWLYPAVDIFIMENKNGKVSYSYPAAQMIWGKSYFEIATMYPLERYKFGRVYNDVTQYNEEFKQCYKWLEKELSQPVGRPEEPTDYDECVIVTHHLPSYHLCHERFKNCKDLNTAFYTDILEQLPMSRVKYWFCGHTHEFMVKKLKGKDGEVIVIVNPMGYPKEPRKTKMSLDVYMI